jgi:peptidyl-prolyl cis-trans isomerase SurA
VVPGNQKKGKGKDQQEAVSILKRAVLSGWAFILLFGSWTSSEAVVDRVVAIVNQEVILLSEIEKWKGPLLKEIQAQDRLEKRERTQEALRKVLDQLVEEKLIDQEVKKSGLKMSAKELDGTIEEIKQKNNMNQEEFEKALAREGLTFDLFKKQIEKQFLRTKLVGIMVKVETKPGEKDLRDFYQKNRDRYRGTETYRPGHIFFRVSPGAPPEEVQEARNKCQKVLDQLRKGGDFGEMAILYSEDISSKDRGDLGFFRKGELIPAIEKEAFRLKPGEVSGCVRSDFGFHIIRLIDRKGSEPPPYEEVKDRVLSDFYEGVIEGAFRQFIASLKEKSVIEIKL